MFFSIRCVIVGGEGGGGGRQEGCLFLEGPPRGLWAPLRSSGDEGPPASHSVQEERTGTHTSAQLCCACAWLEGGRGGGSGWFCGVGEERMGGFGGGRRREGKKDTHRE